MIRGDDLNRLRSYVGRYFKVYDVRWDIESAAFFCDLDPETLEQDFDDLRKEILKRGYIPMLLFEGGEYIIYLTEKAPTRYRSVRWNLFLLLATICTTVFVGAMNWWSYDASLDPNDFWQVFTPYALGNGALFFAFPLMLILGIHETGHYLMARYHGVAASLPFFIPVPLPPLGTFGAFISMREPIPSRKALLDIGVAGPIAGFCVAIPVILTGFFLTDLYAMVVPDDAGSLVYLGTSVFYDTLASMFPSGDFLTHPTALAGWVGLLVTFLNLLPAGQLDGGHVARAMFGDGAKYLSYVSVLIMLALAFYFQYFGWILFIFIIVFLGISHPPPLNDISRLDVRRWFTGAVVFIILLGCFTPVPLYPAEIRHEGVLTLEEDTVVMAPDEIGNISYSVNNLGNVDDRFSVKLELGQTALDHGWWTSFNMSKNRTVRRPTVSPSKNWTGEMFIKAPPGVKSGSTASVNITLSWRDEGGKKHVSRKVVSAVVGVMSLDIEERNLETRPGRSMAYNLTVKYYGIGDRLLWLEAETPPGWRVEFYQDIFQMTAYSGHVQASYFRVLVPDTEPVSRREITISLVSGDGDTIANMTALVIENVTLSVKVLQTFEIGLSLEPEALDVQYGDNATINVTVMNEGNGPDIVEVSVTSVTNLSALPGSVDLSIPAGEERSFMLVVEPLTDMRVDMNLLIVATSKGNPGAMEKRVVEVHVYN